MTEFKYADAGKNIGTFPGRLFKRRCTETSWK